MKNIQGFKLKEFPLKLKSVTDLSYFDGTLLSIFENDYGEQYIYYWCDTDDNYHRWLVFRITQASLQEYLTGKKSLQKLILEPVDGFVYSLDIDHNLKIGNTCLLEIKNLPEGYIPETDSYYESDYNYVTDGKNISQEIISLIRDKEIVKLQNELTPLSYKVTRLFNKQLYLNIAGIFLILANSFIGFFSFQQYNSIQKIEYILQKSK